MKYSNYKEEKILIEDLRKNNQMAIIYLYKDAFPSIQNFIKTHGGDSNDAKDIFQEAILSLYYNLQSTSFNLDCKVKTYLFSISKNLWLNEIKKKNKIVNDLEELEELEYENTETTEYSEEFVQYKKLLNTLEKLGDPCKKILELFYIEKLSMNQIAEEMGYTNAENAKNQKYKCLLRLKKLFFSKK